MKTRSERLGDLAVTVKVGPSTFPTCAQYGVRDIAEVHEFLRLDASWLRRPATT